MPASAESRQPYFLEATHFRSLSYRIIRNTLYKLQAWENGKNVSRHVSRDQADAVKEALAGYGKFQDLTQQYAQSVIDQTRAELAAHSKKKIYNLRRKSSWPKTRRSGK